MFVIIDTARDYLAQWVPQPLAELAVIALVAGVIISALAAIAKVSRSTSNSENRRIVAVHAVCSLLLGLALLPLFFGVPLLTVWWASAFRTLIFTWLDALRDWLAIVLSEPGALLVIGLCGFGALIGGGNALRQPADTITKRPDWEEAFIVRYALVIGLAGTSGGSWGLLLNWWLYRQIQNDLSRLSTAPSFSWSAAAFTVLMLGGAIGWAYWIVTTKSGRLRLAWFSAYAITSVWVLLLLVGSDASGKTVRWLYGIMAVSAAVSALWLRHERHRSRAVTGGALGLRRLPNRIE